MIDWKVFQLVFPRRAEFEGGVWNEPNQRRGLRMVCCVINKANPRVFGVGLHVHYCPLSVLVCWIFTWLFTHEGNKKISRNTCNLGGISKGAVWLGRLKQSTSSLRFCFVEQLGHVDLYFSRRKKITSRQLINPLRKFAAVVLFLKHFSRYKTFQLSAILPLFFCRLENKNYQIYWRFSHLAIIPEKTNLWNSLFLQV